MIIVVLHIKLFNFAMAYFRIIKIIYRLFKMDIVLAIPNSTEHA